MSRELDLDRVELKRSALRDLSFLIDKKFEIETEYSVFGISQGRVILVHPVSGDMVEVYPKYLKGLFS